MGLSGQIVTPVRKNFPDGQKNSGRQCWYADKIFGPLFAVCSVTFEVCSVHVKCIRLCCVQIKYTKKNSFWNMHAKFKTTLEFYSKIQVFVQVLPHPPMFSNIKKNWRLPFVCSGVGVIGINK